MTKKYRSRFLPFLVCLVVVGGIGSNLEAKPLRAPNVTVQTKNYSQFVLKNGLHVVVHEDHRFPEVSIRMTFWAGWVDEPNGKPGLAQLAEKVYSSGITRHVYGPWRTGLSRLYGLPSLQPEVFQDFWRTNLGLRVPSHALELALWLESDRLAFANDGATLRHLTLIRKNMSADLFSPKAMAGDRGLVETQITGHLFGLGEHDDFHFRNHLASWKQITDKEVREYMKKRYVPANAWLVISGDLDPMKTKQWIQTYFAPIHSIPAPVRKAVAMNPQAARTLHVKAPWKHQHLKIRWKTPAYLQKEDLVLDLVADVMSAYIQNTMVGKGKELEGGWARQYSTLAGSSFGLNAYLESGKNTADIVKKLREIPKKVLNDPLLPQWFSGAQKRALRRFRNFEMDSSHRTSMIAMRIMNGMSPYFTEEQGAIYQQMTLAEFKSVIQKYLLGPEVVLVDVQPLSPAKASVSK
jgi:zinc protease